MPKASKKSNDNIKRAQRALVRRGMDGLILASKFAPFCFVRLLTKIMITAGFAFSGKRKKIASEGLYLAFGQEKTPQEIQDILKASFAHLFKSIAETIYLANRPVMVKRSVTFEGREYLEQALSRGKGVIAVSGHFGNFPLMLLRFILDGLPTHVVIHQPRDIKIQDYVQRSEFFSKLNMISSHPQQQCVRASIEALRQNEILFLLLDQNFGSRAGVFVDFFGRKAATATGPVVFALRTQAPILPIFIVRQNDDTHKIIIEPPIQIEEAGSEEEKLVKNVSKLTQIIERYVRQYPQEWGWMHRRWKNQPVQADR